MLGSSFHNLLFHGRLLLMGCQTSTYYIQGVLSLLEILQIYWKFTVFWKFSGLVCKFAHLSQFLYLRVYQYKISRGKAGSIDIEVSNLGNCLLSCLLIGWQALDGAYHFSLLSASKKNCTVYLILVKMSTGNHTWCLDILTWLAEYYNFAWSFSDSDKSKPFSC